MGNVNNLSIIWGSSYILIKKGLTGLTPVQLNKNDNYAILIVPFSINKLKYSKDKIKWVVFGIYWNLFQIIYSLLQKLKFLVL